MSYKESFKNVIGTLLFTLEFLFEATSTNSVVFVVLRILLGVFKQMEKEIFEGIVLHKRKNSSFCLHHIVEKAQVEFVNPNVIDSWFNAIQSHLTLPTSL